MYVLPDPVGACTTTSFLCCNARTASCCHRSGITNPAPNPGIISGRCLQCGLLAIGTQAAGLLVFGCQTKQTRRSYQEPLVMHERRSVFPKNYSLLIPGFFFSLLLTSPLGGSGELRNTSARQYPEAVQQIPIHAR